MINRLLKPSNSQSFFLFGARGTGKSTFIKAHYDKDNNHIIDLLNPDLEDKYSRHPKEFEQDILAKKLKYIVIDEVQKVPSLLNIVHKLIEEKNLKFILTGSSARKLKRGQANLLAGRAFSYEMFPFTNYELKNNDIDLSTLLTYGSLPKIFEFDNQIDKIEFLNSYVKNYLREEIRLEQIVRKLNPFKDFLEISAQCSGKIINFSKISRQVGVSIHSIKNYFQILEDTLIGHTLPAFHRSIRKSQLSSPKFYYFDLGVKRALEGMIDQPVRKQTSNYGELFEHWIIQEVIRHNSYSRKNYKLSYFATKNNVEIDLILTKANQNIAVEIKSAETIDDTEVAKLARIVKDSVFTRTYYISQDQRKLKIQGIHCMNYKDFLKELIL